MEMSGIEKHWQEVDRSKAEDDLRAQSEFSRVREERTKQIVASISAELKELEGLGWRLIGPEARQPFAGILAQQQQAAMGAYSGLAMGIGTGSLVGALFPGQTI